MAPAEDAAGNAGVYEWRVPGKPVSVTLNLAIARMLPRDAGPVAAGGLLLGNVEPGTPARVYVEDCEPLSWDSEKGGAPQLTPRQSEQLADAIGRWGDAPVKSLGVVGFYRTTSAGPLALTAADIELFERHFRKPADVCLLVRPGAASLTGALFIRENGEILSRKSYLEFLFQRPGVPPSKLVRGNRLVAALVWISILAIAAVILRDTWRNWWMVPPSQQAAAGGVEAIDPSDATLGLKVESRGEDLVLTWNRLAPEIQIAVNGVISIVDSGAPRTIELTREELATGHFVYRPVSADVALRLAIRGPGGRDVSETVRVLDGVADLPETYAETPPVLEEPPPRPVAAAPVPQPPLASPLPVQPAPERRPVIETAPPQIAAPKPPSTFEKSLPTEPSVIALESPRRPPENTQPVEPEPQPEAVNPPTVLRSYPASVPKELRGTIIQPVEILLKFHIDRNGKVTGAEPLKESKGLAGSLEAAALRTAPYWVFAPATRNGAPVPSDALITFRFTPGGK